MRRLWFAPLLASLACSEGAGPDTTLPVSVVWMDWPAAVAAGDPFRTRLVVWQPCALIKDFRPAPTADESAVTFAPYFVADKKEIYCVAEQGVTSELLVAWSIDTAGTAPGLPADVERKYEMRGIAASCAACAGLNSLPWATFGEVTVRPTLPPTSPLRNAGGFVIGRRDSTGCLRIRPTGLLNPASAVVVENPPDTTTLLSGFVRGYLYEPAAPVCGESKVFHLVSRN
jgi:hypothetical protein